MRVERLHVGVDIGGSGVRAANEKYGESGEAYRFSLDRAMDRHEILATVARAAAGAGHGVPKSICATVPAFTDRAGSITDCPSLPALAGCRLAAELQSATGADSVSILPDLAAAAIGEQRRGTGVGVARFLCVAIGTGVNAAAVNDGVVVDTAFGCLGDAGHVLVEPDGPTCPCGGVGCLEAVSSGFALARAGSPYGWHDARAVFDAARAGDPRAAQLVSRAGVALGRGLAIWSSMLWPDVIAVAGGVAVAGEQLLQPARAEMLRVGTPYIVGRIKVLPAALGAEAALWGAVLSR